MIETHVDSELSWPPKTVEELIEELEKNYVIPYHLLDQE